MLPKLKADICKDINGNLAQVLLQEDDEKRCFNDDKENSIGL